MLIHFQFFIAAGAASQYLMLRIPHNPVARFSEQFLWYHGK